MRTSKGGWELKLWHFPLSQWLVGSASYELGSSPNIGRELQIGTAKKNQKNDKCPLYHPFYNLRLVSCLYSRTVQLLTGLRESWVMSTHSFTAAPIGSSSSVPNTWVFPVAELYLMEGQKQREKEEAFL